MDTLSRLSGKIAFSPADSAYSRRRLILFLGASLAAHILFFLGCVLLYQFELPRPTPKVVQVDLVSFVPGPAGGHGDPSPVPEKLPELPTPEPQPPSPEPVKVPGESQETESAEPPEPVAEAPELIKPDISLKKKPKNLKDLLAEKEKKKKEQEKKKPEKKLKPKPKKKPQQQATPKEDTKIAKALERMKQAVKEKDSQQTGNGGGQSMGEGAGSGTGMGKQGLDPMALYKTVLKVAIEKNWVFNTAMARLDKDLEVKIIIKILKSGEIRDIIYETRSGNQYLDDSAKKAIQRSNPLPGLPKGMRSWDVLVIFTPKGLK